MENKEPFSHPRWRDNPEPELVGYIKSTEEERQENRKMFLERLRKNGVIKKEDDEG